MRCTGVDLTFYIALDVNANINTVDRQPN